MFRKVLIPLDGSELSESALDPLPRILHEVEDAEATLLFVSDPDAPDPPEGVSIEDSLPRVNARLREWGLSCDTVRASGDPATQILEAVERLQPDLIAMATHGRSGLQRLVRGSVAERILRHVDAPLLLVNPGSEERREDTAFRRILVPLDGSPLADAILPFVIALARSVGSEVTLLRVEPLEPYISDPLAGVPFVEPTLWNPQAVRETLAPQLDRLLDARVDARIEARIGDAAGEIATLANDYDLVALSSHGRSGVSRWWFGSVAEQVLRVVSRPVFLVRGKPE
jgi:nucleotide-binding universal stress UspA family protein